MLILDRCSFRLSHIYNHHTYFQKTKVRLDRGVGFRSFDMRYGGETPGYDRIDGNMD